MPFKMAPFSVIVPKYVACDVDRNDIECVEHFRYLDFSNVWLCVRLIVVKIVFGLNPSDMTVNEIMKYYRANQMNSF